MANNKYKRSVRRERELVNEADAQGLYLACRTAGSKSKGKGFKTDVVIVDDVNKKIILGQVKTEKGGKLIEIRDIDYLGEYGVVTRLYRYG